MVGYRLEVTVQMQGTVRFRAESGPLIISHAYTRFACAHLRFLLLFPAVLDADTL